VSQPTPEDPENRPFQPASYDLAPEFSVPPPQPPPAPPQYPAHPVSGQPPAGGYPPPQPAPPGVIPYAGAPTAAPRKRRRGWLIGLSLVAVVLLGCCGIAAVVVAPYVGEYPSSIDAPSTLAGLDKIQDPQIDQLGDQLTQQLKQKNARLDNAVVGMYSANGDRGHAVLVLGATGLVFSPGREVDNAFQGMSESGLPVSDKKNYDAGALGGAVKCGSGSVQRIDLTVCAWGDHGSVGMGIFYNRPASESATLFLRIREEMLKRG
jgi:hypothetical protein